MKKSLLIAFIIIVIALFIIFRPTKTVVNNTNQGTLVATVPYSCNAGKTITASYYDGATTTEVTPGQVPNPTGSVSLVLSDGRNMTLSQSVSADGTRYTNKDESFVFWSKGNGALVLENNQEKSYIGCILVAPDLGN